MSYRALTFALLAIPLLSLWTVSRLTGRLAAPSPNEGFAAGVKETARDLLGRSARATPSPEPLPERFDLIAKGTTTGETIFEISGGNCLKRIESIPSGASVSANDHIALGATPVTVRGACGEKVVIKLEKHAYHSVKREITLKSEDIGLSVKLDPHKTKGPKKKRVR